jgi:zinc/manganese transport system ATP-binding protein
VLDYVDHVLYLANGRFRLGTPDEVLTSESLTGLYGAPVDVLQVQGRVIVVAATDPIAGHHHSYDDHGASVEPVRPRFARSLRARIGGPR